MSKYPCEDCKNPRCSMEDNKSCVLWKSWFYEQWNEIRGRYGYAKLNESENRKKIGKYTESGELVGIYKTIHTACKENHMSNSKLLECLSEENIGAKAPDGFIYKYIYI